MPMCQPGPTSQSAAMTITVGGADTASPTADHRLGRRFGLFAAVVAASIVLPFIFLGEGPRWYHLAFHLIGVPLCLLAIVVLRSIRRAARSRTLRVMTWISTVAFAAWGIGHAGELVTVLTHGGAHADEHLFEHPVHMFFATIAVPSWMLSVVSSLVLLVTAGIQALRRRVRR